MFSSNRNRIFILTLLLLIIIPLAIFVSLKTGENEINFGKSQEIARKWMLNQCPTYVYDGFDLEYLDGKTLEAENTYRFVFSFQSRASGYGNRKGQFLAQVITDHKTEITVKDGTVTRAITDGIYDEINEKRIEKPEDKQSRVLNLFFYRTVSGQEKLVTVKPHLPLQPFLRQSVF